MTDDRSLICKNVRKNDLFWTGIKHVQMKTYFLNEVESTKEFNEIKHGFLLLLFSLFYYHFLFLLLLHIFTV